MWVNVHLNAEKDLDRLAQTDEEAVGYIDSVIELIDSTPDLFEDLLRERNLREFDPPAGLLGMEVKRIVSLWQQGIRAIRIRLDEEAVLSYRIIYCASFERNPNGSYSRKINILAVADKDRDGFDYQQDHWLTKRIIKDYEELHAD